MKRLVYAFMVIALILASDAAGSSAPDSAPLLQNDHALFHMEEVRIDTGAVTLAGTLLTPLERHTVAAVILIPGSGASTRNGSWNMYRRIGEYLVQRDIMVLLYDKRGVGDSTGDWESETFEERAQDVAAMVDYLRSRPEIPAEKIGLIGHSQGAYIAPLVVAKYSSNVRFVVLLAGPAQIVWDQVLTNESAELLRNGLSANKVDERVSDLERQLRFLRKLQAPCRALKAHYLCFVLDHDPMPTLERLSVPTLAIYAGLDTQVSPDVNIPLIELALKAADNTDYTIHTFDGANHWFASAEIGTTTEMRKRMQQGAHDSYAFVPGFLERIGDWILLRCADL